MLRRLTHAQALRHGHSGIMPGMHETPPNAARPRWRGVLLRLSLFGVYFAWTLAALHRFQDWRNGAFDEATAFDWLLLASLPVLLWIYLRYLSVFGKGKGQCLLPPDDRHDGDHRDSC